MALKEIEELITIGSKYSIVSTGNEDRPLVSTGEFRGYAAFANETALVLKLDGDGGQEEGRIRFIPYHAILAIDVIELAPKKVQEQKDDNRVYYR
ncbi:MAG: hypothetical protein ISF22_09840 [Methanomassiliicoccus sp.]|nr:hypothetical protein [Methanomassiliicoccus sp.]